MANAENDIVLKIAFPDKKDLTIYEVRNIIRCKSNNSYTEFLLLDDSGIEKAYFKKVVSKGLYHFEEFLISTGFFYRIHNQHIINVNHLKKIIRHNGVYVVMDDNTDDAIPISRARKDDFLNYPKESNIIYDLPNSKPNQLESKQ